MTKHKILVRNFFHCGEVCHPFSQGTAALENIRELEIRGAVR